MPDWDDVDGDETNGDEANKSFKDLRNYSKKLEREAKARETELEELRTFKTETVTKQMDTTIGAVFEQVKLPPEHVALFKALNPSIEAEAITPEAVVAFATQYKLAPIEGQELPPQAKEDEGFTPVVVGSTPALKTYDAAEIKSLLAAGNTEEVNRAYKEGRVEKEPVPWARYSE